MFAFSSFAELETTNSNDLTITLNYENLEDNDDEMKLSKSLALKDTTGPKDYIFTTENIKTDYKLEIDQAELQIDSNEKSLTYSLTVPVNVDSGETGVVGTIVATDKADATNVKRFDLKTDVESMLDVKKITLYVNGDKEKTVNDDDDEELKNLEPGDEIELKFEVDNLFDKDYDEGDLDITFYVELDDSDFGDDIDEEEDYDLEADETFEDDDVSITFTVPTDAEDGDYDLNVRVKGKDGNKAIYEIKWVIGLEVERENDDVRVSTLVVLPKEISCNREATITANVVNFGTDRQSHAALTLYNQQLNLDQKFEFALKQGTSSDNSKLVQHIFPIEDSVKPGDYTIIASALYDYTSLGGKESAILTVKDCVQKKTETKPVVEVAKKDSITDQLAKAVAGTVKTQEQEATKVSSSDIVKTVEKQPYTVEDAFIALIIVAMIIIFAMMAISITLLARRK
ncbi:hypothetical protein HOD05_05290 [Candidatus Woesearchaeota archaeon]|nr:hypothetical protein [Candidatus Woesearchaeota archaeon]MBT4150534.1 hypothetical protein [Candidatus Woesearchaeota archaeon]MBT4247175.1 hypothetical protein [Candidatus Woesearchaeota archaeon]MBT4434600.1 hypothetical protein [Candidatus Woesearchaeota archaeon]MBT7332549.1 hypothetical protein [Candidatus Woesearchaeota archaeon]